jgi:hypothetical protein
VKHLCPTCGGTGRIRPDLDEGTIDPKDGPPELESCPTCGGDGLADNAEGRKVRRIQKQQKA